MRLGCPTVQIVALPVILGVAKVVAERVDGNKQRTQVVHCLGKWMVRYGLTADSEYRETCNRQIGALATYEAPGPSTLASKPLNPPHPRHQQVFEVPGLFCSPAASTKSCQWPKACPRQEFAGF